MVHGDDDGLRVPPALAPTQVVVIAVKAEVVEVAHKVGNELRGAGLRVGIDDRTEIPFGRRAVGWELKGVPLRVEIGPRDLAADTATLVRRISGGKDPVPLGELSDRLTRVVGADQQAMLDAARAERESRVADVSTLEDAAAAAADGWARLPWSAVGEDGEDVLAGFGVTVRCLQRADGSVPDSDDEPDVVAYVARAY
jgi:prolyl-tRNA synthetase